MTFPRALLIVLTLLQASGIVDVMRRAACEEECRRDGCNDACAPDDDCPRPCHCPTAASAMVATTVTVAPVVYVSDVSFVRRDARHASPDPRDILHVPRSRTA